MKKQYCVVIPIYKEDLDCVEEISINRLRKVLVDDELTRWHNLNEQYEFPDVYLVYPEGIDITKYKVIYNRLGVEASWLKFKSFDPEYFKSTATYSQLCISYDFYKAFDEYEYMLIYQLDCYLFKDEIKQWCDKGFDYIGGPIISTECGWDTVKKAKNGKEKWHPLVGNGGLSLRKIETFLEITDPEGELRKTYDLTDEKLKSVIFEDKYFCNDLYNIYELEIPDWKTALSFAIDMSVDIVYNVFKLDPHPMGAHSIDKNIRWWKKVIPEFIDNTELINYCEEKHKEFFKLYYDENDSTLRVK